MSMREKVVRKLSQSGCTNIISQKKKVVAFAMRDTNEFHKGMV